MDDEQCIACNSDDIPCREHGRYDDAAHEGEARAAVRANERRERCLDCGGEGGGGTMDPDEWIKCTSCRGRGYHVTDGRDNLQREVTRLREELDMARDGAELWSDAATKHDHARLAAEATVARVEAVADDYDKPGSYAVASRIRAALKGEES